MAAKSKIPIFRMKKSRVNFHDGRWEAASADFVTTPRTRPIVSVLMTDGIQNQKTEAVCLIIPQEHAEKLATVMTGRAANNRM